MIAAGGLIISSVWPSAGARTAAWVAMLVPAPGRFSLTNCWPPGVGARADAQSVNDTGAQATIWHAAVKRPGFVLFVAVKPCKLPSLIDHYRRCELYGISDEARRQDRAEVRRLDAHAGTAGGRRLRGA